MSEEKRPAFIPLWHLIGREKVAIGILASAIQKNGIQGWDRFGRFDTFKADSKDPDHATRCARVLDALAAQHAWDEMPDGGRSPLDEAEDYAGSGHSFEYGWLEGHAALDFSAIVAAAAGQPVEQKKKPSKRAETSDLNIIAALLQFLMPKAGYTKEAPLINDLLEDGWGEYDGISARNLQQRFADAKKSLTQ